MISNPLFFATTNTHKVKEVELFLKRPIVGYKDFTRRPPVIVENGQTFEENAYIKAKSNYEQYRESVLTEDSGIFVEELKAPGIHSARYAHESATDQENLNKLIEDIQNLKSLKAYYKSTFVYYTQIEGVEKVLLSNGILEGHLSLKALGNKGFGYDPIFIPKGYENTLGELGEEVKTSISHRTQALRQMEVKLRLFFNC